ncbi:CvpA family protein [Caloramator sp. CAR-1]|uniref:CvpA family protein n=1 Tax=Caloramator sp. CAR-1 TaxID=3062777 RepID=UPI0026E46E1D|nr:CvpA family protein [Caloramator sp. CAR-1]MDO6354276.1 CvpA family protein [Caloramator sp. CAR-1]
MIKFNGNLMDIVIILLLLYGCIDGLQKGFISTLLKFLSLFFSLYLAKITTPYLTLYIINNTEVYLNMQKLFLEKIEKNKAASSALFLVLDKNNLSKSVTDIFLNAACFFVIFIVANIVFNIIRENIRVKVRRGKLGFLDKLLGMFLGFIKWVLILFIVFALMIPVVSLSPKDSSLKREIESSRIAKYFYYYNIVFSLVKRI